MHLVKAVHTTSSAASTILLDILCYPHAASLLAELREEADAIMPRLLSDPKAAREMIKLDSVIHETLRLHSMFAHGMTRQVMPKAGVTTPDGLWLPQGCNVAALVIPPQRDSCEKGEEWQPLRFYHAANSSAQGDEAAESATTEQQHVAEEQDATAKGPPSSTYVKQTMAVQINPDFLSFGLGKHACPGRFFAVQTMEVMLGYLLTQYDFEPFAEEPKYTEIVDVRIPKEETKFKVRRRKRAPTERE